MMNIITINDLYVYIYIYIVIVRIPTSNEGFASIVRTRHANGRDTRRKDNSRLRRAVFASLRPENRRRLDNCRPPAKCTREEHFVHVGLLTRIYLRPTTKQWNRLASATRRSCGVCRSFRRWKRKRKDRLSFYYTKCVQKEKKATNKPDTSVTARYRFILYNIV